MGGLTAEAMTGRVRVLRTSNENLSSFSAGIDRNVCEATFNGDGGDGSHVLRLNHPINISTLFVIYYLRHVTRRIAAQLRTAFAYAQTERKDRRQDSLRATFSGEEIGPTFAGVDRRQRYSSVCHRQFLRGFDTDSGRACIGGVRFGRLASRGDCRLCVPGAVLLLRRRQCRSPI